MDSKPWRRTPSKLATSEGDGPSPVYAAVVLFRTIRRAYAHCIAQQANDGIVLGAGTIEVGDRRAGRLPCWPVGLV